jgi:hypothetical protein
VISSAPSRLNSSIPRCEMESAIRIFGAVIQQQQTPTSNPQRPTLNVVATALWAVHDNEYSDVLQALGYSLSENDELNGIGQLLGDVCGDTAAKQFCHGRAL